MDTDAHYSVDEYPGVAFYTLGYEKVRDEDYDWSGIEYDNLDRVRMVMVGDDRVFTFDAGQVIVIDEDDFCHGCGQIGCTADGR